MSMTDNMPCVVASINSAGNYDAATIASEGNVEIMLTEDTISRIIAQTCRQSGLSDVMTELFDFGGDELYYESFTQLDGKKFGDVLNMFEKAVVFGFKRGEKTLINPDPSTILESGDKILLLMEDNNSAQPSGITAEIILNNPPSTDDDTVYEQKENVLILGTNNMLPRILKELDAYATKGAVVTIADDNASDCIDPKAPFENIKLNVVDCDTGERASLDELANGSVNNIVLLSPDDCDMEQSDALMLLKLIHLRDICEKKGLEFNITSEMRNPANQKLAKVAKVNDFVIGNYIVNMIMAQISENRDLAGVFRELLHPDGSEIYIKNVQSYPGLRGETNFYNITETVKRKNEIAIGYKTIRGDDIEIIVNPRKSDRIVLENQDAIIVLSSD